MAPPSGDTVIVRHGELGVKSHQVQHRLERLLGNNLERMLADRGIDAAVTGEHGRLFIRTGSAELEAATDVATDTVGVASASPSISTEPTMDAITDRLAELAAADPDHSASFAVRARRAGDPDAHPFSSQELERTGGEAVWSVLAEHGKPTVDLEDPDRTYFIECRRDEAFVFREKWPGPGGFPYGSQGHVIALISGGIDSPVAAWEMMRSGCELTALYFDFEAFGGPDHVARAFESVRRLARYAPDGDLELVRVPSGDIAERLVDETGASRMLSLRRYMFGIAERVADRLGADALATGESLGQKSSQTGPNLALTGARVRYPIHRPLLSADKQDIIDRAKELGTWEEASIDAGCNRIAPTHPETAGEFASVIADEPVGFGELIEQAASRAETVRLERLPIEDAPEPAKRQA